MTEKRFTCHQMIADYSTSEDIDFDFLQELIDEQKQPKDLRMHISDGNKIITYRECVDLLNELADENGQLKQFKEDVFNKIDMHLRMLPTARDEEFNEENGDPSLYTGAIYMLETLKKELEE